MVEQHGKTLVPQIRFAGFTDPWEQRKVGDFLSESRVKGNTGLNSRKLTVKLWGKGVIEKNDFGGSEHTQYFIRHKGQFIYSKLDFLNSAFGVIPEKLDGYESTADLPAFDLVEMNPHFMFFTAVQEGFYLKHGSAADGSRKAKRIHVNTFLEMPIMVPTVAEQDFIVEYLQSLDCLITLHQRKYDKLCVLKKSMLDKMFPKGGSLYPEIRFAGFADPWEQRKLGEVANVCSGRDYKHLAEGPIPVYGTGGYMTSVSKALSYDEDAIGIGRKGTIDKPYRLRAPFWTVDTLFYAIPEASLDINFLLCSFLNVDWKSKDESTGLPSLSKRAINETEVLVPDIGEQRRIGAFFDRLDSLITLHQRKYCGVASWMLGAALVRLGSESDGAFGEMKHVLR